MALSDEMVQAEGRPEESTWPIERARPEQRWRLAGYLGMALAVLVVGLPVYWTLIAAFKTTAEIYGPPTWVPVQPTLDNFSAAWAAAPFARYYLNSLITAANTRPPTSR